MFLDSDDILYPDEDFKLALERFASMSKSEIETMKDIARIRAESVFNLDTYSEEMYQFIKSI